MSLSSDAETRPKLVLEDLEITQPASTDDAFKVVWQLGEDRMNEALARLAESYRGQLGPEETAWISGARARFAIAATKADADSLEGIRHEIVARVEGVRRESVKTFRLEAVNAMFEVFHGLVGALKFVLGR